MDFSVHTMKNLQLLITEDEINIAVHMYSLKHIENLQIKDDSIV